LGTSQGAPPPAGGCRVVLDASRTNVRPGGDLLEIRTQAVPEGCSPAVASRAEWAQRLTSDDPAVVRLSVTANPGKEPRITAVHIGDKVLVLEQAGVEAPAVSVVPGKLPFGIQAKKILPKSRRIAIEAEDPNAAVAVTTTAAWIIATPVKGKAREYDVRIDPDSVPAIRRSEAAVRVSAGGTVLDVPVIAERPYLR
jgi:hypothetical protein